jgi:hypothetical protein
LEGGERSTSFPGFLVRTKVLLVKIWGYSGTLIIVSDNPGVIHYFGVGTERKLYDWEGSQITVNAASVGDQLLVRVNIDGEPSTPGPTDEHGFYVLAQPAIGPAGHLNT